MTSPTPEPTTPDGHGTETAVAVAAVGLALLAIESRVRSEVTEAVAALASAYTNLIIAIVGVGGHLSGVEITSRADVHALMIREIGRVERRITASIQSGYTAGAQLALARATRDLRKFGHEVADELPYLGGTLDDLVATVKTAVGDAQTSLANAVQDAFDDALGDAHADVDAVRVIAVNAAIKRVTDRLRTRLNATGANAVHRGSRDAQIAVFDEFERVNPYIELRKIWRVTSKTPCGMCLALDGTDVGINEEFDHTANDGDEQTRPVYGDLLGPPRHPNCRCQLELVVV